MSVLWLESGYTMKYSLCPWEIPWALPRDFSGAQAIFHRIFLLSSQYRYRAYYTRCEMWILHQSLVLKIEGFKLTSNLIWFNPFLFTYRHPRHNLYKEGYTFKKKTFLCVMYNVCSVYWTLSLPAKSSVTKEDI